MHFAAGNRLTLLHNGAEYFPALEAALDGAALEIFLETYIFENDASGLRIATALQRAARRGVRVHVMVDGFGSRTLPPEMMAAMNGAGVQVLVFRPEVLSFKFRRRRLRRMHRKIVVIDGKTAFIGGINIIDDMHTPKHTPPRFDYAVKIEGPLLRDIHAAAKDLWERAAWTHFKREWRYSTTLWVEKDPHGEQRAALVVRDNVNHRRDIEQAYLKAIQAAREEVIIANAYFLPGRHFRRALVHAVRRGVRVKLLLQGRVEYVLLHYASRALYGNLLDAGVEIYEYHKSFMHAKVAVADGDWATVGSSNIDPFSLLLAHEANVVVQDEKFAGELRLSLLQAIKNGATLVARERWAQQPRTRRVLVWVCYGVVRFLAGMFGYGREQELKPRR
ncbi:MAG: cardiolipin synthase ClsB [Burkholderiales bacterium]